MHICFLKPERMRYEATSTEAALAANGRIADAVTPWHLIVDTDAETVTVRKCNKYLIGVDEEVLSFRFIRNIRIDTHLEDGNRTEYTTKSEFIAAVDGFDSENASDSWSRSTYSDIKTETGFSYDYVSYKVEKK